jgi:hypothetical protein
VKKLLLNCDQVFDALTRGPFPSGSPDDEGVEHHLRACHECRQLAEALRPAVSLLHEAVAADEASDLPEYQGSLPPAAPRKHIPSMVRREQSDRSAARRTDRLDQSLSALRLLAASVLVAALSLLAYSVTLAPGNQSPSTDGALLPLRNRLAHLPPAMADLPDGTPDNRGLIRLASLQLPAACFPEQYRLLMADGDAAQLAAALASGSQDALRCCTECHRAGLAQPKYRQLVAIAQESCKACHRG